MALIDSSLIALEMNESNYFGDAAKIKFFGKFRQLTAIADKLAEKPGSKLSNIHDHYRDMSPRSRFLTRFIHVSKNAPLPIVIRSDTDMHEVNLSHMNLHENYIQLLGEVICDLPRVSKVTSIFITAIYLTRLYPPLIYMPIVCPVTCSYV